MQKRVEIGRERRENLSIQARKERMLLYRIHHDIVRSGDERKEEIVGERIHNTNVLRFNDK